MVSFLDYSDVLVVDLMFFVLNFMIFLEIIFDFIVSQEEGLIDLFAIEVINFLEFSEEGILVLGPVDGELDLIDIVIGNLLNVHGFVRVGGKREGLVKSLPHLLSLFNNSLGGGGFKFGDWH